MNEPSDSKTRLQHAPAPPDETDTFPAENQPTGTLPFEDKLKAAHKSTKFGPPAAVGDIGTLGRFRIKKEVGRGGMGVVYLAFDTRLLRQVALKVMLPQAAANPTTRERFIREARSAARILHDNVIGTLDADEIDDVPYIALPFLQGYPLDDFLRRKGNPSIQQALRMGREIALGLAAAHELNVIHRDIKPSNIWLEAPNGRVKILDFGLAKPVEYEGKEAHELTQTGQIMGTPAYMAPEQAAGMRVDNRADVYSLGAVLYRLVTGRQVYDRPGGPLALLAAVVSEDPKPVHHYNAEVPKEFADLIHELLHKDREQRPQTAAEVAKRIKILMKKSLADEGGSSSSSKDLAGLTPMVATAPHVVYVPVPAPLPVAVQPEVNAFANIDESIVMAPPPPAPPKVEEVALPSLSIDELLTAKKRKKQLLVYASLLTIFLIVCVSAFLVTRLMRGGTPTPKPNKKPPTEEPKPALPKPAPVTTAPPAVPGVLKPTAWVALPDFTPVKPSLPSPLDNLDATKIPANERHGQQPPELVAVVGSHVGQYEANYHFTPDGKRFATLTGNRGVKIFDTDTLKVLHWDRAISGSSAINISPDGQWLAVSTNLPRGPGVKLYDIAAAVPQLVRTVAASETNGHISSAIFPSDGKTLLTLGERGGIQAWNLDGTGDGTPLVQPAPDANFSRLGISMDGKTLVSRVFPKGDRDGAVQVWDLAGTTAKERCSIPATEKVNTFVLSQDGKRLVTGHETKLVLWNIAGKTPMEMETVAESWSWLRMLNSGKDEFLARPSNRSALKLWSFDTKLRAVREQPRASVSASPDGRRVLQHDDYSVLRVLDETAKVVVESTASVATPNSMPALGQGLFTFWPVPKSLAWTVRNGAFQPGAVDAGVRSPGGNFQNPAVSPDGLSVAANPDGGWLSVYAADGDKLQLVGRREQEVIPRFAWGPDGKTLFYVDADGIAFRWKPFENAEPVKLFEIGYGCPPTGISRNLAVSPSGQLLAVGTPRGIELVNLADAAKPTRTTVPKLDTGPTMLAFSADGRHLYFSTAETGVTRVDLSDAKLPAETVLTRDQMQGDWFDLSSDGRLLVTAARNGRNLKWWDAMAKPLGGWNAPEETRTLQLAPDGRHFLIEQYGTAYVLDLTKAK